MNHALYLVAVPALLLSCSAPKQMEVEPAELQKSVEAIPAVGEADQPVLMVRVDPGALSNIHTIQFVGPGGSGGGSTQNPTKALEYRASRYLNATKRFKVPSYDDVRHLRELEAEGLVDSGEPTKAIKPHYSVKCTILEMNAGEQGSRGGWGVGPVRWGNSESIATVKVAVEVVSLLSANKGQTIWNGEAKGEQSSKGKRLGVNVGLFRMDNSKSTSPTLDDALELCVMDLVRKLAENVPTLSGSTVGPSATDPAAAPAPAEKS
jgi:hypothetical protein